jgi:hypothetical protein
LKLTVKFKIGKNLWNWPWNFENWKKSLKLTVNLNVKRPAPTPFVQILDLPLLYMYLLVLDRPITLYVGQVMTNQLIVTGAMVWLTSIPTKTRSSSVARRWLIVNFH